MAASTAEHERAPVSSLRRIAADKQLPHQPKGVVYIDSDIPTPTGDGGGDTPPARAIDAEASEYYGGPPVHSRARTLSSVSTSGTSTAILTSRPGSSQGP